jgi:hypothetical protein
MLRIAGGRVAQHPGHDAALFSSMGVNSKAGTELAMTNSKSNQSSAREIKS